MNKQIPTEYTQEAITSTVLTGTDIYLSVVTAFLSAGLTRSILMLGSHLHDMTLPNNFNYAAMAITAIVAVQNSLNTRSTQRNFRTRVWNSVCHGLNTVFISPFTMLAQVAQNNTDGFQITEKLFD